MSRADVPGVLALFLSLSVVACGGGARKPSTSAAPAPAVVDAGGAPPPVPLPDDLEPATAEDRPDAGTVTIKLYADARRQARVFWGRKDLGVAPLQIVRPRGSAPLDLTVQAPECLPLHTRVFTDRDDTLTLRLYTDREAIGLPGYSPAAVPAPSSPTKTRRQF